MIKAILIINNHGKPRLSKFYTHTDVEKQQKILRELFQLISRRTERSCNFLECGDEFGKGTKIIYRQYATLFFIFWVDGSESELGILDLIQVVVETLDKSFENVCELDLIFHVDKVNYIIDEIVMGGMVLETSTASISEAIEEQNKIEKTENVFRQGLKDVFGKVGKN